MGLAVPEGDQCVSVVSHNDVALVAGRLAKSVPISRIRVNGVIVFESILLAQGISTAGLAADDVNFMILRVWILVTLVMRGNILASFCKNIFVFGCYFP